MNQLSFLPRVALVACLLVSYQTLSFADFSRDLNYDPSSQPDRYQQRQAYLDAMQLIRSSQFSKFNRVKPALADYVLYPYLEYTEYSYRISRYSEAQINDFTQRYADTPLVKPLLQHWLASLAKQGKWDTFLRHYNRVAPTKVLACHHGYALYKTGASERAMQAAAALWTVGFSQPDECDPIFAVWRGNGGITRDIGWQRFALSLTNNEKKLSSYLMRFVDKDDKTAAANFRQVHLKPNTILRYKAFASLNPKNQEIILHGVRRLARSDASAALTAMQHYESVHDFDAAELESAYAFIGIRLALQDADPLLQEQLPVNFSTHTSLIEARLRQSLKNGNWSDILVLTNLLPQEIQDADRWQYWKARALVQAADAQDQASGRNILLNLSTERSFYGFLAADLLQLPYQYQIETGDVSEEQMRSLETSPGIARALELFALGERAKARSEWNFSTNNFTLKEREVAASVALRWGWYKASIQTMIDARAWSHLDYRFPVAWRDDFLKHARRVNIPVPWSLAIARQESAFMPDARSSAGAMGLMQLMPGTAKLVARQTGVNYDNSRSLTQPSLNIQLGSQYLRNMLNRFDNNRILASAAYNAGPGRANRWLEHNVPFDIWIEIIPFTETRNYVQNVLMFSNIYSMRLGETRPLIYPHEQQYFPTRRIEALTPVVASPIREDAAATLQAES